MDYIKHKNDNATGLASRNSVSSGLEAILPIIYSSGRCP